MSLINEALKKAQHQRTGGGADAPPMPGGGSGHRGNQGMPKGMFLLLLAGAAVVIVVSVVVTVYFVNRPTAKVAAAAPVAPAAPAVSTPAQPVAATTPTVAPSPVIIAPVIVPTPPPVVDIPSGPPPAVELESAHAVTPAGPEPVEEGSLQDRIAAYVEKVRVTGIRTSESGSKVLMNDKVYRLNDVVDRKLGLRLVKIAPDSLTFADVNGATYVKNF
jgi:hypothetical protein